MTVVPQGIDKSYLILAAERQPVHPPDVVEVGVRLETDDRAGLVHIAGPIAPDLTATVKRFALSPFGPPPRWLRPH